MDICSWLAIFCHMITLHLKILFSFDFTIAFHADEEPTLETSVSRFYIFLVVHNPLVVSIW